MLFPSHVKRIILCFVYSENHHPSCIYPTLEEEIPQPYTLYVDSIPSSPFILKNELCNSILPNLDKPCDLEEIKIDSKPCQISTPLVITSEPCQQLAIPHDHLSVFQIKIRTKIFKPLRLPYLLHPYPLDCYEYLPLFSGENQVSVEKHLESFEDFVDCF